MLVNTKLACTRSIDSYDGHIYQLAAYIRFNLLQILAGDVTLYARPCRDYVDSYFQPSAFGVYANVIDIKISLQCAGDLC